MKTEEIDFLKLENQELQILQYVKTEKWRQSEKQKQAEEKIKKAWWNYFIVRNLQDVIDLWF